jgi:hypothetical protein
MSHFAAALPLQRARNLLLLVVVLVTTALMSFVVAPAWAGMYDYTLTTASNSWVSRYVNHDYSYLRGNMAGATVCLSRTSTGASFCGAGSIDHHYADPCNPSACITWYLNGDSVTRTIDIHDEWR